MPTRKRFGQNFLRDPNTIHRIVSAIDPRADDVIVEVGPGHGALTEQLVESGCRLHLVEIDFDLVDELRARYGNAANIIQSDVLKLDLNSIKTDRPLRVVGNLPYNISTPLLFRLFQHIDQIQDMHFMLQLEVVDRIVAAPSTSAYGRLSVMCQYYCAPTRLFSVSAAAFVPKPKVMSSVIRLEPRQDGSRATDVQALERLLIQAFSQRRKTIRNAMKPFLENDDFETLSLDPGLRPENLTLDQFVACANHIAGRDRS